MSPVDLDGYRVIAEGDFVAVHTYYKNWNMAAVDILRLTTER
jgi:hypothetical protein